MLSLVLGVFVLENFVLGLELDYLIFEFSVLVFEFVKRFKLFLIFINKFFDFLLVVVDSF